MEGLNHAHGSKNRAYVGSQKCQGSEPELDSCDGRTVAFLQIANVVSVARRDEALMAKVTTNWPDHFLT